MNWKGAPELIEYLLMYLLMPLEFTKELYSENIFLWCNILPLGESAVTFKSFGSYSCNLMNVQPYEAMSV